MCDYILNYEINSFNISPWNGIQGAAAQYAAKLRSEPLNKIVGSEDANPVMGSVGSDPFP